MSVSSNTYNKLVESVLDPHFPAFRKSSEHCPFFEISYLQVDGGEANDSEKSAGRPLPSVSPSRRWRSCGGALRMCWSLALNGSAPLLTSRLSVNVCQTFVLALKESGYFSFLFFGEVYYIIGTTSKGIIGSGHTEKSPGTCHKFKTFQYSQSFSNVKDRRCGNLKKNQQCSPQGELLPSSSLLVAGLF